eukprot:3210519-Prorocentrum_lima.AAC.1
MQVLETPLPEDAPTFGNRVLIAKPPQEVHAFEPNMEEGIFLCWGPKTIQGAYVASVRSNGNVSIGVASAPTQWPHEN